MTVARILLLVGLAFDCFDVLEGKTEQMYLKTGK